ncbi:MAG: hypothetical protein HQL51_03810 [Magnetococcales bacterium]|nr:hypothetical protein [Magnetococcales bacterium]
MKPVLNGLAVLATALTISGCNQTTTAATQTPATEADKPVSAAVKSEAKAPAPVTAAKSAATVPAAPGAQDSKWGNSSDQVKLRLDRATTLIEKSTMAQKVASSGNADALALQQQARASRQQAEESLRKGKYEEANTHLGEASRIMFEAAKLADGGEAVREKVQSDFDKRLASINELMKAHDRIADEKGAGSQGRQTKSAVEAGVAKGKQLAAQGQLKEGRAELDKVYVTAKLAIEKMRRGEQLVRSLNFASKADEYHYELDRNDTHKMLVKMLVGSQGEAVAKTAEPLVEKSDAIRKQAESQAASGQHEEAIKTLEAATQELIKAIRAAGIYIPS